MSKTIISSLAYPNPASAGLAPIDLPDAAELAVFNHPSLKNWWRADSGAAPDRWRDRKGGAILLPRNTNGVPGAQKMAAYGGHEAMTFNGSANQLYCEAIFEAGAPMGWLVVGRAGPADNAYLLGTNVESDQLRLQWGGNGLSFHQLNGQSQNYTTVANSFTDGPLMFMGTNRPGAGSATRLITRSVNGLIRDFTTPAQNLGIAGTQLKVSASGPAWAGQIDGGDIAEILIFNSYIGDDAAYLDALVGYVAGRYGWSI